MGWNSWNAYHCDVSEDKIVAAANQIVDKGLRDVGYEYVNRMYCASYVILAANNPQLTIAGP